MLLLNNTSLLKYHHMNSKYLHECNTNMKGLQLSNYSQLV